MYVVNVSFLSKFMFWGETKEKLNASIARRWNLLGSMQA